MDEMDARHVMMFSAAFEDGENESSSRPDSETANVRSLARFRSEREHRKWLTYPMYTLHYVENLKACMGAAIASVRKWPSMYGAETLNKVRAAVNWALTECGPDHDFVGEHGLRKRHSNGDVFRYLLEVQRIFDEFERDGHLAPSPEGRCAEAERPTRQSADSPAVLSDASDTGSAEASVDDLAEFRERREREPLLAHPLHLLDWIEFNLNTQKGMDQALDAVRRWPMMLEPEALTEIHASIEWALAKLSPTYDFVSEWRLPSELVNRDIVKYLDNVRTLLEEQRPKTRVCGFDASQVKSFLESHVRMLAVNIGERNIQWAPDQLDSAAAEIILRLHEMGYEVGQAFHEVDGHVVQNIEVSSLGMKRPGEIVVIGAHYDTIHGTPGADDNSSGVAVLLEVARLLSDCKSDRTLRLVAFANEEPPYFQTSRMGSRVYAKEAKDGGENIVAVIALDSVGYFSDEPGSQALPLPLELVGKYPTVGNFISVVGNLQSQHLVDEVQAELKASSGLPVQSIAAPDEIAGVGWSDHWSFWQEGYPAVMITDTAPFRNPHYHRPTDTIETLDFDRMTEVARGMASVVRRLIGADPS